MYTQKFNFIRIQDNRNVSVHRVGYWPTPRTLFEVLIRTIKLTMGLVSWTTLTQDKSLMVS